MRLSRICFILTAVVAVLGCNMTGFSGPTQTPYIIVISPTPDEALPTATLEAALPVSPTQPSIPIPTPLPTPVIPAGWVTHPQPLFGIDAISYAPTYELLTGETISVDNVRSPAANTLGVLNHDPAANFFVIIENVPRNFDFDTVQEQAIGDMACIGEIAAELFEMIGWIDAALYRNTPCGPRGSTLLYVFDSYNGHTFFRITVSSPHPYEIVEPLVEEVLSTVVFTQHPLNFIPPTP